MAVQILNDMPDAAVHRGDPGASPANGPLSDWSPRATEAKPRSNRPLFIAITAAVHVVAIIGFLSVRHIRHAEAPPAPIVAEILEAPESAEEAPPLAPPPMQDVVYSLPSPDVVSIEVDSITPPPVDNSAIAQPSSNFVMPPLVESVECVRCEQPPFPKLASRKKEYGTVVLRVLVDTLGRAAQVRIEKSSGYERLDRAAQDAAAKFMFRPYEVDGVAQAAQVLIPFEFTPPRREG